MIVPQLVQTFLWVAVMVVALSLAAFVMTCAVFFVVELVRKLRENREG